MKLQCLQELVVFRKETTRRVVRGTRTTQRSFITVIASWQGSALRLLSIGSARDASIRSNGGFNTKSTSHFQRSAGASIARKRISIRLTVHSATAVRARRSTWKCESKIRSRWSQPSGARSAFSHAKTMRQLWRHRNSLMRKKRNMKSAWRKF